MYYNASVVNMVIFSESSIYPRLFTQLLSTLKKKTSMFEKVSMTLLTFDWPITKSIWGISYCHFICCKMSLSLISRNVGSFFINSDMFIIPKNYTNCQTHSKTHHTPHTLWVLDTAAFLNALTMVSSINVAKQCLAQYKMAPPATAVELLLTS